MSDPIMNALLAMRAAAATRPPRPWLRQHPDDGDCCTDCPFHRHEDELSEPDLRSCCFHDWVEP